MSQKLEFGSPTTKLAAINLDWSIISAKTIHKCVYPFLINPDNLESVKVYKTKFGKEKLDEEEKHGPKIDSSTSTLKSQEIVGLEELSQNTEHNAVKTTKKSKNKPINQNVYNYNLDRKKYFIAILYFKTVQEAENIYNTVDTLEIEDTGNYFDLRFIDDYEVCDCVEECYKDEEYQEVYKKTKDDQVEWEDDTKREYYIASLFDKEEFDSDIVHELIDLSGEDEREVNKSLKVIDENQKDEKKKLKEKRIDEDKKKNNEKQKTQAKKTKMIEDKENEKEVKLDLCDERFVNVLEDEDYSIDVTHNTYKNNENLKEIVKEKRKKRKQEE